MPERGSGPMPGEDGRHAFSDAVDPKTEPLPRVPSDDGPLPVVPRTGEQPSWTPDGRRIETPAATEPPDLNSIEWAEEQPVTPAAVPIAQQPSVPHAGNQPTMLTPEAVGRSAWDDGLATVGAKDPEGWDQLSWSDMDDAADEPNRSLTMELLREWVPVVIAAVAIALFTRLVLVQAYHIPSGSMLPTLEDGHRVVVNRLSYRFGEIQRGQVIVFKTPQGEPAEADDLIKRVIALPGETIEFRDGQVFVNELLVQEPYLRENLTEQRNAIPGCAQEVPRRDLCVVPDGYVFVMGDNRSGSRDSRVFGPVSTDTVVGRAFLTVWPVNEISAL